MFNEWRKIDPASYIKTPETRLRTSYPSGHLSDDADSPVRRIVTVHLPFALAPAPLREHFWGGGVGLQNCAGG